MHRAVLRLRALLAGGLLAGLLLIASGVNDGAVDSPRNAEIDEQPLAELLEHTLRDQNFQLLDRHAEGATTEVARDHSQMLWAPSDVSTAGTDDSALPVPMSSDMETTRDTLQRVFIDGDRRTRWVAIREARKLETDRAVPLLALALTDEDERLRVKAIFGLAKLGGQEATAALAVAASDQHAWVRTEAVHALGTIGSDVAVRMLERAMQDPDPEVREEAIRALENTSAGASVDAIAAALQDPEPAVREEAVEVLGALGGDVAIEMIRYARTDPNSVVRRAADQALQDAVWEQR